MINIPNSNFTSELHDGDYIGIIERSEERIPRSGDGSQLFVMIRIAGPVCIGAVVFDHITLSSSNAGAVYYGARKLSQLIESVNFGGHTSFEPSEIIGKSIRLTIKMKFTTSWGWQPEIMAYSKAKEESASADNVDTDIEAAEDTQDNGENIPF